MLQPEVYMRRCFDLALNGGSHVSPNPMVGCVIVATNRIIGEGWHMEYGKEHAEVNAIANVVAEDRHLLKEATLFVNLEPCFHFGKTPPCADRIISEAIPNVVISNSDPNPLVGGQGIEKLKAAGLNVQHGVLENDGRKLNRHFFTFHEKKRPYITLKWAQSADGYISRTGERTAVSGETALRLTHQLRAGHQSVLIGANTALIDNPLLSLRYADGRQPMRILIDPHLRVPNENAVFSGEQKTIVFNTQKSGIENNLQFINVGAENFLPFIMETLYNLKIQSILVEGGAYTLQQFIDAGLWDEALIYRSPANLFEGVEAPKMPHLPAEIASLGTDKLYTYTPCLSSRR